MGDSVSPGDITGTVQETSTIEHRAMIPPGISGKKERKSNLVNLMLLKRYVH